MLLCALLASCSHAPMGVQSTSRGHIQLRQLHLSEPPSLQSQSRTPSFPWLGGDWKPSPPGDALSAPVPTSAPWEGAIRPRPAGRVPLGAAGRMRARLPADVSAGSQPGAASGELARSTGSTWGAVQRGGNC